MPTHRKIRSPVEAVATHADAAVAGLNDEGHDTVGAGRTPLDVELNGGGE